MDNIARQLLNTKSNKRRSTSSSRRSVVSSSSTGSGDRERRRRKDRLHSEGSSQRSHRGAGEQPSARDINQSLSKLWKTKQQQPPNKGNDDGNHSPHLLSATLKWAELSASIDVDDGDVEAAARHMGRRVSHPASTSISRSASPALINTRVKSKLASVKSFKEVGAEGSIRRSMRKSGSNNHLSSSRSDDGRAHVRRSSTGRIGFREDKNKGGKGSKEGSRRGSKDVSSIMAPGPTRRGSWSPEREQPIKTTEVKEEFREDLDALLAKIRELNPRIVVSHVQHEEGKGKKDKKKKNEDGNDDNEEGEKEEEDGDEKDSTSKWKAAGKGGKKEVNMSAIVDAFSGAATSVKGKRSLKEIADAEIAREESHFDRMLRKSQAVTAWGRRKFDGEELGVGDKGHRSNVAVFTERPLLPPLPSLTCRS